MKKKRKLIHRIGALLCALVVAVSVFSVSEFYFADDSNSSSIVDYLSKIGLYEYALKNGFEYDSSCGYALGTYHDSDNYYKVFLYQYFGDPKFYHNNNKIYGNFLGGANGWLFFVYLDGGVGCSVNNQVSSSSYYCLSGTGFDGYKNSIFYYNDYPVTSSKGGSSVLVNPTCWNFGRVVEGNYVDNEPFNSSLGYLQNVHVNHVFKEAPLGEWANDTFTSRWYYDNTSTTGVDLTNGNYMIRYYQERWIVTGYEEDDVVDKGERYLLGDYIVQNGYIETYSEDIESTLAGQGYEEPNFSDLWFNKFVTTHYYFQIVDTTTSEVGGLLHIYLTDDNGHFGVELIGQSTDLEGNIVDDGYSGFIDEGKITTDDTDLGFTELEQNNDVTLEEWLEDLRDDSVENLDGLDGSGTFDTVVQGYVSQVSNVSKAVGVVLFQYPAWLLGSLSVGACCLFIGILIRKG